MLIRQEIKLLLGRLLQHDRSKFSPEEAPLFAELTPRLRQSTYGSEEYQGFLEKLRPALEHHYTFNPHHPEHFEEGIRGMSLIDLLEMVCDWMAATRRHRDGSITRSIETNQERFGYTDELKQILLNTVRQLEQARRGGRQDRG